MNIILELFFRMISLGYEFCRLDCTSLGNFTIMLFNSFISLLLTIYIAHNSYLSYKRKDFGVNKAIYMIMLAWGISISSIKYRSIHLWLYFRDGAVLECSQRQWSLERADYLIQSLLLNCWFDPQHFDPDFAGGHCFTFVLQYVSDFR